ncbi:hypothetical protein [Reyranella massiliensis]|nr:hypothetical protein [Reyranella massiliensis]
MSQIDQLEADLDQLLADQRRLREELTAILMEPEQDDYERAAISNPTPTE